MMMKIKFSWNIVASYVDGVILYAYCTVNFTEYRVSKMNYIPSVVGFWQLLPELVCSSLGNHGQRHFTIANIQVKG